MSQNAFRVSTRPWDFIHVVCACGSVEEAKLTGTDLGAIVFSVVCGCCGRHLVYKVGAAPAPRGKK